MTKPWEPQRRTAAQREAEVLALINRALAAARRSHSRAAGTANMELACLLNQVAQRTHGRAWVLRHWLRLASFARINEVDAGIRKDSAHALAAAPGALLKRDDVTPNLLILRVAKPKGFHFVPGQYTTLSLGGEHNPYSIASAPHEPFLEFCIEHVPQGHFTRYLWALRPGECVTVADHAEGVVILDEHARHHLMFATVTGIAPFVSMLRHQAHVGFGNQRFTLLHGAGYQDELVYRNELEILQRQYPGALTYLPMVSRPAQSRNAGWQGVTGRVTDDQDRLVNNLSLVQDKARVYACGHPQMVEAVKAQFESNGFAVTTEAYW